ncbi:tyrosine-type recombinase/integrase [Methylobacterium sp. E-045]|uniref:tyrosine-type recombinase/integrase n=1 Tax=Methylobacterium sp. E-045 TaxID=2836575 RepID=UPI001FB9277A|nr:site-specific integrase [Methylobacterium sp. E-045]MCJ2127685.1 site-specific integrase [Methylobacterium sp. E-045]
MSKDRKKAPEGCYWRGGTLWARFVVAGKEYRFSLKTGDPVVARGRQAAEHARIIAAASFGDGRKRWEDVLSDWSGYIAHHVGDRTWRRYLNSLKTIGPHLDGLFVDEISEDTVAAIIKARRTRKVTTATIRRDLTALSSVLSFAVDEKWRKGNPALEAMQSRRMKERRDPIVLPEDRDIAMAVERAPGNFKFLIQAALLTGCRQDELVTLERRHVDLQRRAISVHGKGNKRRVVSLSDEAVALFRSIPPSLVTRSVFWHSDGRPFVNVATRFSLYGRQLAEAAAKNGREFRRFRFHDLRHRFAVDYLRSGRGSIYTLQQELGHTSLKVTEIYLAFLTAEEAQAAKDSTAQNPAQVYRFAPSEAV